MSTLHCWTDRGEADPTWDKWADEMSYTCMLESGHGGPHEWTPDGDIGVSFAPAAETAPTGEKEP